MYEYAISRNPDVEEINMSDSAHQSPADTSLNTARWTKYQEGRADARSHLECRVCGNTELRKYLDLGMMPLANNLAADARGAVNMERFPLQVLFCTECSMS